jgi:hypothetical protein
MLKHLGFDGYRDLIEHDLAVADRLAAGWPPPPSSSCSRTDSAWSASACGPPAYRRCP